jgi:hypothetical protein
MMRTKLVMGTAVATLGLAGPAWAASPLDEYQQTGHITPCRYSAGQLQGSVPNDVAQYAPEYAAALQSAARQRASSCGGAAAVGGSSGRGVGPGGAGGGPGGSNTATGAGGAATPAVVAAAQRAQARAAARRRAQAQARLAAVTFPATPMPQDSRVPNGALLLAALPILLLLGLAGAFRIPAVARGRRGAAAPPRTSSGAIAMPPPAGLGGGGNGQGATGGNGSGRGEPEDAPTEEVEAVTPGRKA